MGEGEAAIAGAIGSLDIRAIMACIPHRYPMLLVDRVEELILNESITAVKAVSINEAFFAVLHALVNLDGKHEEGQAADADEEPVAHGVVGFLSAPIAHALLEIAEIERDFFGRGRWLGDIALIPIGDSGREELRQRDDPGMR